MGQKDHIDKRDSVMNQLNIFQKSCEERLILALTSIGRKLSDRIVKGVTENYITAKVSGTSLDIYIYEDEAGIQGPDTDIRFEAPDYDSPNDLIESFINKIIIICNMGKSN